MTKRQTALLFFGIALALSLYAGNAPGLPFAAPATPEVFDAEPELMDFFEEALLVAAFPFSLTSSLFARLRADGLRICAASLRPLNPPPKV